MTKQFFNGRAFSFSATLVLLTACGGSDQAMIGGLSGFGDGGCALASGCPGALGAGSTPGAPTGTGATPGTTDGSGGAGTGIGAGSATGSGGAGAYGGVTGTGTGATGTGAAPTGTGGAMAGTGGAATDAGLPTGGPNCGNGVIDSGEACDTIVPPGTTCSTASMGALPSGILMCAPNCRFDLTRCHTNGSVGGSGGATGTGGKSGGGAGGTVVVGSGGAP